MKRILCAVLAALFGVAISLSFFADSCLAEEKGVSSKKSVCPEGWTYKEKVCTTVIKETESVRVGEGENILNVKFIGPCEGDDKEACRGFVGYNGKAAVLFGSHVGDEDAVLSLALCDEGKDGGYYRGGTVIYRAGCSNNRALRLSFYPLPMDGRTRECPERWERVNQNTCITNLEERDAEIEVRGNRKLVIASHCNINGGCSGLKFYEKSLDYTGAVNYVEEVWVSGYASGLDPSIANVIITFLEGRSIVLLIKE